MVVIFLPATSPTMVWHERTASPLTWTVQAPHSPAPHPNLVPVICNCSRMAHSSGVSFAASTDMLCPLMLRVGIVFLPLPVRVPLTTATHFVGHERPPGRRPLGSKNDRVPTTAQRDLNCGYAEISMRALCGAESPSHGIPAGSDGHPVFGTERISLQSRCPRTLRGQTSCHGSD